MEYHNLKIALLGGVFVARKPAAVTARKESDARIDTLSNRGRW
jgi:hypothetical protein